MSIRLLRFDDHGSVVERSVPAIDRPRRHVTVKPQLSAGEILWQRRAMQRRQGSPGQPAIEGKVRTPARPCGPRSQR